MLVFVMLMLMVSMLVLVVMLMVALFVLVLVLVGVGLFMFMPVLMRVSMAVVIFMMMVAFAMFAMLVFVLVVRVRRAFVDAELHAFHLLPLLALEVHVEIAEVELGELPFESGGLHAEVDEGADGHVAGNAGKAVEEENFHREVARVA